MAKSHAAYLRKQAAIAEAAYKPHRTSLRSCTLKECKVGRVERRVKTRKMTKADKLSRLAHLAGFDDIALLIDQK